MRRSTALALLGAAAIVVSGCGFLEPKPRTVPAGFAQPRAFLISDEAQGPILLGGDFGLRSSLDGGRTWTTPDDGDQPVLAVAPYDDQLLVSRGVTRQPYGYDVTKPSGEVQAWPFPGAVTALAGSARRSRLWAVTRDGAPRLMYSNDGGRYWWQMSAIGLCPRPRSLATSPQPRRPDRLWVACGRQGLLVSDDLGVNFRKVDGIPRADDVAAARGTSGHAVVATPQVAVTRDNGETWRYAALYAERLAVDPRSSDLVFAISGNGSLVVSLDGGLTF